MAKPEIHIALPVMDENAFLPSLLNALSHQTIQDYRLYVCVNQPEVWWQDHANQRVCRENMATMEHLHSLNDDRIDILDKSSPGNGWIGKAHGIGWARRTLMERISVLANSNDIILSLDADTSFGPAYLESVRSNVILNPDVVAFSIPYYHKLTGDTGLDRVMLRYEIYMRAYAINLWRINSPYCFTALGSAIALPVWAYRSIGGITPKLSGEDFYFLQKLVKFGKVLHWNQEKVYPAARLSERVYFGTGPALIKGMDGNWDSYPVYSIQLYKAVAEMYNMFPLLFEKDLSTPMDDFLLNKSAELPWKGIRKNCRSMEQFVRACHEKLDGLRILQYLKERSHLEPFSNEAAAISLLETIEKEQGIKPAKEIPDSFTFTGSPVLILDSIRNALTQSEMTYRMQHWSKVTGFSPIYYPGETS
jgi:hypothetical protein